MDCLPSFPPCPWTVALASCTLLCLRLWCQRIHLWGACASCFLLTVSSCSGQQPFSLSHPSACASRRQFRDDVIYCFSFPACPHGVATLVRRQLGYFCLGVIAGTSSELNIITPPAPEAKAGLRDLVKGHLRYPCFGTCWTRRRKSSVPIVPATRQLGWQPFMSQTIKDMDPGLNCRGRDSCR
jgi:hypothetical protein